MRGRTKVYVALRLLPFLARPRLVVLARAENTTLRYLHQPQYGTKVQSTEANRPEDEELSPTPGASSCSQTYDGSLACVPLPAGI